MREQRWAAPTDDVLGAVDNLLEHYEQFGERAMAIGSGAVSSPAVAELGRVARQVHYDWIDHAFGRRLKRKPEQARARCRVALIALCDVQVWWIWSHDLGLAGGEVRATLVQAIETLLREET